MKYPPPTPEELQRAKALVLQFRPQLLIAIEDIKDLVFQAEHGESLTGNDDGFYQALMRIVAKIDRFTEMDETQFLNKPLQDVTSQSPKPSGAKRTFGHVVPSKREQQRRQSGGGHRPGEVGYTPMWDEDEDVPF